MSTTVNQASELSGNSEDLATKELGSETSEKPTKKVAKNKAGKEQLAPSVLSFNRALAVSDATMKNLHADGSTSPIVVVHHSVIGTMDEAKKSKEESESNSNVTNIQSGHFAKTAPDATGLIVEFNVRATDLHTSIANCSSGNGSGFDVLKYRETLSALIERICSSESLQDVATRIARNIANGRFLWRNRLLSDKIEIAVSTPNKEVTFSAYEKSLHNFEQVCADEKWVASVLAEGLAGRVNESLRVRATVLFDSPAATEVYPSQMYVEEAKGRVLYTRPFTQSEMTHLRLESVGMKGVGEALIRDHKISNALKTIDTWYPEFESTKMPIAVEPTGANLDTGRFFRKEASVQALLANLEGIAPNSAEERFFTACLVRGGVFGG